MPFKESLEQLLRLPPDRLHRTSLRWRRTLGESEWKLGLCLLAWQRRGGLRRLGYRSLTEYAELGLQISGQKLSVLLATVRALEHLPLLCEAFQAGQLCWSKLRELQSLVTPETQGQWLEYALRYPSAMVAQKVALSPLEWKRQRALQASLDGCPIVDPNKLEEILTAPIASHKELSAETETRSLDSPARSVSPEPRTGFVLSGTASPERPEEVAHANGRSLSDSSSGVAAPPGLSGTSGDAATPPILAGQSVPSSSEPHDNTSPRSPGSDWPGQKSQVRLIRLVADLTPDQYAAYETAKRILEAKARRRLSRAEVLLRLAESVIDGAPSRTRSKHQIVIHSNSDCRHGWYDTDRGMLPVAPELFEDVRNYGSPPIQCPTSKNQRNEPSSQAKVAGSQSSPRPEPRGRKGPGDGRSEVERKVETTVRFPQKGLDSSQGECPDIRPHDQRPAPVLPRAHPQSQIFGVSTPFSEKGQSAGQAKPPRTAIPSPVLRQLQARASGRCEICGARGRLHVHHRIPICEGGTNDLETLMLVCWPCHHGEHEVDFATKPHWSRARTKAMERRATQNQRKVPEPS